MDTSQALVDDNRVKRFINDHRKCPFYVVTLENGENVDEVFRIGKFYFFVNKQLNKLMRSKQKN